MTGLTLKGVFKSRQAFETHFVCSGFISISSNFLINTVPVTTEVQCDNPGPRKLEYCQVVLRGPRHPCPPGADAEAPGAGPAGTVTADAGARAVASPSR